MSVEGIFHLPRGQVERLFGAVARTTGQSTADLMRDVMGLWAADLVRQTYPVRRKQGVGNVAADALKVFSSIDAFESQGLKDSFKRGRDFEINDGALLFRPRMAAAEMAEVHDSHRDRRGRVSRRVGQKTVVSRRALNRHIRQRQQRVGRLKAGWMAVAQRHGVRVPGWVAKHGASESRYDDTLDPRTLRGELVAINDVPYATKLEGQFMDFILRKRIRDLTRGTYAKRWEKKMERATRVSAAA